MEKCSRCGGEITNWAANARYCNKCRIEVDKELADKRTKRLSIMRTNWILEVFNEGKINMSSLCDYLGLSHNGLYNKLNQWLDLTLEQKKKASEWFDGKIRLMIRCKVKLDKDLKRK